MPPLPAQGIYPSKQYRVGSSASGVQGSSSRVHATGVRRSAAGSPSTYNRGSSASSTRIIQPVTVVAVALIRLCKTTLPPVVILREAVAVHAVIPAVLPVRQVVVLQEEDRYSIQ